MSRGNENFLIDSSLVRSFLLPPYKRRWITKIAPPGTFMRHPVKGSVAELRAAFRYIGFNLFIFVGIHIKTSISYHFVALDNPVHL